MWKIWLYFRRITLMQVKLGWTPINREVHGCELDQINVGPHSLNKNLRCHHYQMAAQDNFPNFYIYIYIYKIEFNSKYRWNECQIKVIANSSFSGKCVGRWAWCSGWTGSLLNVLCMSPFSFLWRAPLFFSIFMVSSPIQTLSFKIWRVRVPTSTQTRSVQSHMDSAESRATWKVFSVIRGIDIITHKFLVCSVNSFSLFLYSLYALFHFIFSILEGWLP